MISPSTPRRRSPFADTTPAIGAALAYAVAALVWTLSGVVLPGGRWFAVHLFTLGVLTNLVLVFSDHFAHTLLHAPLRRNTWQLGVVNVGVLVTLAGVPTGSSLLTAVGSAIVVAVVLASWARLRRLRLGGLGARFEWVVRSYESAHVAFLLGATVGALIGVGAFSGDWYLAARAVHLHLNLLGWAGLTLLGTLVLFGPTMLRTRLIEGAEERSARALILATGALAVAMALLLASGGGGDSATALRVAAGAALAVHAAAVSVVCHPVIVSARRAKPSAARVGVAAVAVWFPVVASVDAAAVAAGRWWLLDALGLAMLLAVLGQSIMTTLLYLAPMLRADAGARRERIRVRTAGGATARGAAFNLGVAVAVVGAAVPGDGGQALGRLGWGLLAAALLWTAAVLVAPAGGGGTT